MTLLGDAYIRLRPDTTGFQSTTDRAMRGIGKKAALAFSAGIAAAGGLVAMGVKTAAAMEQADIAFTTMLGSAKEAKSFLSDLRDFAAKTPFEFPELQTAASSLISVGISADKVIPIMTSLGNATSGMGTGAEGVKRATVALQQMNAAGRITGEDLNQLRDAGIPVFDLLTKATGKTTAEIAKMAQSGKLGKTELDAMMKALETGKGLERFNGLMEKQSQSLSGMFSTLKDTINMGMADLIAPALPAIKRSLGAVSTAASATFGGIRTSVGWVRDGVKAIASSPEFTSFTAWLDGVRTNVENLSTAIGARLMPIWNDTLYPALQTVGGFLRDHLAPILSVLAGMAGGALYAALAAVAGIVGGALISALGAVVGFLSAPVVVIGALVGALIYAYNHSARFRDMLKTVADFLVSTFRPTFEALVGFFTGSVLPAFQGLVQRVKDNWGPLQALAKFIGAVIVIVGALVAKIVGFLLPILIKLAGFFVKTLFAAIGKVIGVIGGMVRVVQSVVDKFKAAYDGAKNFWDTIKSIKVPEPLKQIAGIAKDIGGALGTAGGALKGAVGRLPGVGDGPGRAGKLVGGTALHRVQGMLAGTGLHVTSTYRTPQHNREVGGSPTSYHTDRNNPAVDIAGPTAALDALYPRLAKMGGWRELLWRVAGHYDHIHVAHSGGTVSSSWARMPGDRSDERTTRLQVGERVLSRREVSRLDSVLRTGAVAGPGGAPITVHLTSTGQVRDDLDEVAFQFRRMKRGGVHA